MKKSPLPFLCILLLMSLGLTVQAQAHDFQVEDEFRDGRGLVRCSTGSYGFINTDSILCIPCQFKNAGNFWNGRATAMNADYKWGYIDTTGNWVISPQYESVRPYDGGFSIVSNKLSGPEFLIDSIGGRPFANSFATLRYEENGIYRGERDGKYAFFKPSNKEELAGGFDATGRFYLGYAFACTECEWDLGLPGFTGGTWYLVSEEGDEYELKAQKQKKTPLNNINTFYEEATQKKFYKKWIRWSKRAR